MMGRSSAPFVDPSVNSVEIGKFNNAKRQSEAVNVLGNNPLAFA